MEDVRFPYGGHKTQPYEKGKDSCQRCKIIAERGLMLTAPPDTVPKP